MRFASLGSGSGGNALVVEAGETRLLLDCGFGLREAVRRLARLGLSPESLSGILVTHEHSDHADGAVKLARRHGLPLWLTHGTLNALSPRLEMPAVIHVIDSHAKLGIGDLEVEPYPVPHDAREPVQFVFGDGVRRLGVLTDVGCVTPYIAVTLEHCDALVLECNHDPEMLRIGPYPYPLKKRVAGKFGHLSNEEAAALLGKIGHGKLQHVVAAHISQHNNTPSLAVAALAGVLGCEEEWIGVADQEEGFGWRQVA